MFYICGIPSSFGPSVILKSTFSQLSGLCFSSEQEQAISVYTFGAFTIVLC